MTLRIRSLSEIMKPLHAHLSLATVRMMETVIRLRPVEGLARPDRRQVFDDIVQGCRELELIASMVSARKIQELLSEDNPSPERFHELVIELQGRMIDEMSMPRFFSFSLGEVEYYNNPTKDWDEVIQRFPSAITDIEEMGKCFALSRYAGAVFHSVQAIECSLIEFGKFLEVKDPKSGWTAVIGKLATLVSKTKYPDLPPHFQNHFAFLEQMHATISALNNAWRNKISHAQGRLVLMTSEFNQDVAEEIIVASRSYMRRLATELPEIT